jgi:hypothetical protein
MRYIILLSGMLIGVNVTAATWHVGPTQTYTMPSQVSTLVNSGDTVLIDSGMYASDVALWSDDNLVLKGVGGMARLHSNGLTYGGKAIWVISGDDSGEHRLCRSGLRG